MIEFKLNMLITGIEQRQSKKEGSTPYTLVHVMGGNGQTLSLMYKGDTNKVFNIERLKEYLISFAYIENGQYKNLVINDIQIDKK